jgi:Bacterial regulatory protein, arsR family.
MAKTEPAVGTPSLLDHRLVKALQDPTRAYILNVMTQRPASSTELAREMGREAPGVAYHVKKLLEFDCIEEVRREPRRAATEIFYRATIRHYFDAEAWAAVPVDDRLGIAMGILLLISGDLDEAIKAQTICAPDVLVSRNPMKLDTAGWMEVRAVLETAGETLIEIRERAAKRLAKSDDLPRIAKVTLMQVETPGAKLA